MAMHSTDDDRSGAARAESRAPLEPGDVSPAPRRSLAQPEHRRTVLEPGTADRAPIPAEDDSAGRDESLTHSRCRRDQEKAGLTVPIDPSLQFDDGHGCDRFDRLLQDAAK